MFDRLLTNVRAATMSARGTDALGIIENAAIGVTGGKIAFIGPENALPAGAKARETADGGGKWATPAFIDCHTHLIYAGNRAEEFEKRLQGISYEEIARAGGGILSSVRATRGATEQELFDLALRRMKTMLMESVGTFEIKSGYGLDLATERKILRVATRLRDETNLRIQRTFLGAHALPPEYEGRAGDYIDFICTEMLPALHAEKLVDAVDGFCENIGFSRAQIEKVFKKAQELGLPVKLHAEQLSNSHGAALAAQYGALSADHIEYLDEEGVQAMEKAGTVAVLLPGAFYFIHEKQAPPVELLRKHNVKIAIATDHNPGTAPTLSLLLMLNMACTLFHLTPEEALLGVTRHAARALGFENVCGTLEEGKAADLALWDVSHPRDLCYCFPRPAV